MSKPPGYSYSPDELSNIWADLRGEGQHKCQECGSWYDDDVTVCPDCDEPYEQESTVTTIHHIYDENGDITITNDTVTITSFVDVVQVYVEGVPMLRFISKDATRSARILANLIFHTNKEFAS